MDYLQIAGSIPFSKFLKKQRTKKKVRKTRKNKKKNSRRKLTQIKVRSSNPITLKQLRKKAIKKNRAQLIELHELEYIVAQEKNMGKKYTFIFDGSAMVDGKYISDFLLSGKTQQKGQLVYLNGVSKGKNDNFWSSGTVQVCDGNTIAWRCMGGTMIYNN